jgi:hypothetical protein
VDAQRTRSPVDLELAHQAEALVRSLAGVTHARVQVGPRGIEAIHVIASDHDVASALAAHVRSALLAGLAAPVRPARITVRVADNASPHLEPSGQPDPEPRLPPSRGVREALPDPEPDQPTPPAQPRETGEPEGQPQPRGTGPRLVAIDMETRGKSGAVCRVTIAHDARIFHGEASAGGRRGTTTDAAANAAIRALESAGIIGLALEGLRRIDIGERDYLIVALSRIDPARRVRSGSAPCFGSAERAAAEATVAAATELL